MGQERSQYPWELYSTTRPLEGTYLKGGSLAERNETVRHLNFLHVGPRCEVTWKTKGGQAHYVLCQSEKEGKLVKSLLKNRRGGQGVSALVRGPLGRLEKKKVRQFPV